MDGKALLLVFFALCGVGYYLSTEGLTIGTVASGPSAPPKRLSAVVDLRHEAIRAELAREGQDLSDPRNYLFELNGHTVVGGPIAATEHGAPVFVSEIFQWHAYPGSKELPARVEPLPLVQNCHLSPPANKSRIANVWSGPTLQNIPVYAHFDTELDDAAVQSMAQPQMDDAEKPGLIERFRMAATVGAPTERDTDPYQLSVMDVVITETEAPVHLILQTSSGRLMWNLSLKEGVTLSGITLLGGDIVALANLPRNVPVEALTARELASCAPMREQRPLASDPVFKQVEIGLSRPSDARAVLERRSAAAEEWNQWFQFQFGVRDDSTRIGYDVAGIAALVGPLLETPEDRVGYHGFKGRTVHIVPDVLTILSEPAKADLRWRQRVQARAKSLGADSVSTTSTRTN